MRLATLLSVALLGVAPAGNALAAAADDAAVTRYERADQAWLPVPAEVPVNASGIAIAPTVVAPAAEVPDAQAAWTPVALPALVRGMSPAASGVSAVPGATGMTATADARQGVWWYRLRYSLPAGVGNGGSNGGGLALYLPRVSGAAVQVARAQDGFWLLRWDGRDGWREQWNQPILVDLGPLPAPGEMVEIAVGLTRPLVAQHRLARISIGPRDALEPVARWRRLLQNTAPQVGSLTFVSLGLISLIYWLGRRADRAYLLFALTSIAWLLRNLHYYVTMPTEPWLYDAFWWLSNASLSWVMVLVYLFALRFDDRRYPRIERWLLAFVVLTSLAAVPWGGQELIGLAQLHLVNAAVSVLVAGWLGWLAWHGGGRELRTIALALVITDLAGVHDLLLLSGVISPESVYLLPLATLAIFFAFLFAVQTRYAQAMSRVEQANAVLEQRLAEREAELRANHERLRGIEREQALLIERQRLMRDMHDGLGSTLMSSLVLVEQGRLGHVAVAELLRECVDDLRLVIDSLEPIGQDLVTLLASLRYRLGRRLEAAGLDMEWAVEDLPPLAWLQAPDALQVLRIVQEVLTNVLKHARARHVRIATSSDGEEVRVLIEDDGLGFDPVLHPRGRGLSHLNQRAGRLGGRVVVESQPGAGTRIRLHLPLERRWAA